MSDLIQVVEIVSTFIWPVLVFVVILMLRRSLERFIRASKKRTVGDLEIKFDERLSALSEAVADIRGPDRHKRLLAEKRDRLLKIPNVSFHFADRDRISSFYNDYFREPTVDSLVREIASEVSGDVSGKLPQVIEAKAGGKDLTKWISTIRLPETSLNGMFLRYQRETIKSDQVELGMELSEVELSELEEFDNLVDKLSQQFSLSVLPEEREKTEVALKERAAEQALSTLERATGWVLVEGSFLISDEGNDFYKCMYTHPVSSYTEQSGHAVHVSFLLPKSKIEPSVAGNYLQSIGGEVPLHIYGEIWQPLNRNQGRWEVQITPLAVY
ncbi:hypothetical protein [Amphritea balenae]|uniref:Uncharacterized protein n=1 Tax=Amphritea balenae TaxID=452629 RepID=A0A3P1SKE2_9GAMM|nr:hypothetical protein [Amphritea balenae]RRC97215.1 hypothetical protein EHS89_18570 [Amphritea balenae]GGK64252.1 hypothetical protein GCM10007941_12980 [Amphritea balenae]